MRLSVALLLGAGLGVGGWWWSTREERELERIEQERQAAAAAEAARPVLYRWRDAQGHLQVSAQPPKGRKYERVDMEPRAGIEVHGNRDADLPEVD
ncbi:DUF4124 domain-containing protein [Agrilutibacter solisilvae]|uniref:DUF4124 domain-containing protein n=1 Tax=Agrilutibacter solisilvae TaxID=2763317 RepID=A0A974Y1T3_9GAMM|nr:DUF4124 domain-containing protein [Lysobacter solisilvae]QSX79678.1 DUF4124 domain-containing protein [Lysobacter solisilvae]